MLTCIFITQVLKSPNITPGSKCLGKVRQLILCPCPFHHWQQKWHQDQLNENQHSCFSGRKRKVISITSEALCSKAMSFCANFAKGIHIYKQIFKDRLTHILHPNEADVHVTNCNGKQQDLLIIMSNPYKLLIILSLPGMKISHFLNDSKDYIKRNKYFFTFFKA